MPSWRSSIAGTWPPKDPSTSDIMYVSALTSQFTIITMPESTLRSVADHGEINTLLRADGGSCEETLAQFKAAGVDVYALATRLQEDGTKAFIKSWWQLMTLLAQKAAALLKT